MKRGQVKIKTRDIAGIAAGFIIWWVALYTSFGLFILLWPELLEVGRAAVRDNDWSLITTPMLAMLIVMYFWVNPIAGWLTVFITKNHSHAWITVIPLALYAAFQHWYTLWNVLPDWYNLAVVLLIPPLVYLGGKLVKPKSNPVSSSGIDFGKLR